MNCPHCGNPNPDTASICSNCGKPLHQAGTYPSAGNYTPPPPPPSSQQQPSYAPPPPPHAGYGGPGAPRPHIPNYLVPAILVTLCCCLPFGIVAIVFAAQVNSKLAAGDIAGATAASRNAKMWCWLAFGIGLLIQIIWVAFYGGTAFIEGFREGMAGAQ